MSRLMGDLRYAIRMLGKSPGFTAAAAVALALGIGANSAIFSLVDGLLFRALPVDKAEELVRIGAAERKGELQGFYNSSYPVFTDYRDGAASFSGVAMFADENPIHIATGNRKARRVNGMIVSGNYFSLLGVRPARGRLFTPDDDRTPGGHPVVVLSDRLWRGEFAGDPAALGAVLRVNGEPFTVIGVAPADFFGVRIETYPDLWLPAAMAATALPNFADLKILEARNFGWVEMIARLKPGVTIAQAQAELDVIAERRAAGQTRHPDPYPRLVAAAAMAVDPEHQAELRRISWLLIGVVGLVLAIACAVTAGLLLARAERRQKEISIRFALGASRGDVIRQLLVENALLAALGAAAGVLVAAWLTDALVGGAPPGFAVPVHAASPLTGSRVFLFTLGVALLSTAAFGLLPAWRASRREPLAGLKAGAGLGALRVRSLALRNALVVAQIAVSAVLLVGAGLLLRTLWNTSRVKLGFRPENTLLASLGVSRHGYDQDQGARLFGRLLEGAKRLPGVESAAFARSVPVQRSGMRVTTRPEGYVFSKGEDESVDLNIVSPGYFHTLGVAVLRGREFGEEDRAESPAVVIVNQAFADRYWPGKEAIGKFVGDLGPENRGAEVVGIVGNAKTRNVREPPGPLIYVPQAQFYMPAMTLVMRSRQEPGAMARAVSTLVEAEDKNLPLYDVQTLEEHLRISLSKERIIAGLLGFFGALALLLTAGGLYAVLAYLTEVRTREFGIRMALGAQRRDVARLVVRQGAALALSGTALGGLAAWFLSRTLSSLVFGIGTHDPTTFIGIAVLLLAVCWLACLLPARRATRVDPMTALRAE